MYIHQIPDIVDHILLEVVLVDHSVQLEQDIVGGAPVPDSCQTLQMTSHVNSSKIQRRSNSRETLGSILKTNFYK